MRLNSERARMKAEELAERMQTRLSELQLEKNITAIPPILIGAALVIPSFLLAHESPLKMLFWSGSKTIERIAMHTVMNLEKEQGFLPKDVSSDNCGYDILSKVPESKAFHEGAYRFIEVKGRTKGSTTVTVTKNEILRANFKMDF